jgi:hypothetical protein
MSSFLDNSGDIILDAVLTDIGRQRLARADGSFKISFFGFGDDEINYKLYDTTQSTAARDLNILKTPVFEAFTNSASSLKNRLLTLNGRDNSLFLPVARLNLNSPAGEFPGFPYAESSDAGTVNSFVILANQLAVDKYEGESSALTAGAKFLPAGFINGVNGPAASNRMIVIDQGLDTTQLSYKNTLDPDLNETEFYIQSDDRLLIPVDMRGGQLPKTFTDTDSIATYMAIENRQQASFRQPASGESAQTGYSPIQGPRGASLLVSFTAATSIASSDYLFDQIGTTVSSFFPDSTNAKVIDSVVRIVGDKTGISIDVPVRIVRAIS